VFHAAFSSIGKEYFEAARIDGANDFIICFKIILPLVRNMFFSIFLLKFILFWNDYQSPLLYLPTHPTLSLGAYNLRTNTSSDVAGAPAQMAICMIMMIPVLALFVAFRKMIMGNISMGGVKE
jgi:ABC-type glycerol-3-phosphate transport system permease component